MHMSTGGINTNGIVAFGQHMQTTVPEFYDLTMVQLCSHPLFASVALNASTSASLFYNAFGNLTTPSDVEPIMQQLNHGDKCFRGIIILAFLTVGSLVFVSARLYARWLAGQKMRFDDYTIVASLSVCSLVQIVEVIGCFVWHIGRHMWDITFEQYKLCLMVGWIVEWSYYPILFFLKASILYFYYNLLSASIFLKRATQITFVVLVLGWAFFFVNFFQCRQFVFWKHPLHRKCFNEIRLLSSIGIFSIITDILILAIPVSVLPKLTLRPREKILLAFLFALGAFTCIASILRLVAIHTLSYSLDWTFDATQVAIWSIVEVHTGIMCACAPHLKAFVYQVMPSTKDFFQQKMGTVIPWRTESKTRRKDQYDISLASRDVSGTNYAGDTVTDEDVVDLSNAKGPTASTNFYTTIP